MAGKHNKENQKLVGCYLTPDFLAEIDKARGEQGRSQFLRDSLYDKLKKMGFAVPRIRVVAPDRAGKGGRTVYRQRPETTSAAVIAENHIDPVSSEMRDVAESHIEAEADKIRNQNKTASE